MLVINAEYINTNSDTVQNVFSFASWESKRGRLLLKWPSGVAFSTLLHLVTESKNWEEGEEREKSKHEIQNLFCLNNNDEGRGVS